MTTAKDVGFFETPELLAARLVKLADVHVVVVSAIAFVGMSFILSLSYLLNP